MHQKPQIQKNRKYTDHLLKKYNLWQTGFLLQHHDWPVSVHQQAYRISDHHEHAFCVTSSTGYEPSNFSTGRLRVGWLVRVISESFSTLVFKTCGPINTTRDTNMCSPNRRNHAMHDHFLPISVLSLPDPPIQWFILVFRTCYHHRGSFSQHFWGGSAPQPMTRSATLGRAFTLDGAFFGTIDMPYVLYMLFLRISMLSYTFILRLASARSLQCPFPSDVPGQHRRAFVTNMQVPFPIVN
jgi:hypothetical protein